MKAITKASSHCKYSFELTLVDSLLMHFVINFDEKINVKSQKPPSKKLKYRRLK